MNNIQKNIMEYIDSDVTSKKKFEVEGGYYSKGEFSPWDIKKRKALRSKEFKIPKIVDVPFFREVVLILLVIVSISAIAASVGLYKRIGNLEEKVLFLGDIETRLGRIQKKNVSLEQVMKRLDRVEASLRVRMEGNVNDPKILQKKILKPIAIEAVSSIPGSSNKKLSNDRYHIVRQGETLYSISRIYGVSVKRIRLINKIPASAVIYPGQKIIINQ